MHTQSPLHPNPKSAEVTTQVPGIDYLTHHLPDELVTRILTFCQVLDVIRVRQCSRRLHSLSFDQHVWLSHLSKLASWFNIPAFAISNLTDPNQVEKATTAHLRVSNRVRQTPEDGHLTDHAIIQSLSLPTGVVGSIKLVPGGRFLVILANFRLQLVDLDARPQSLAVVSSLELPAGLRLWLQAVEFSSRFIKTNILEVLCRGTNTNAQAILQLYRIDMSVPSPQFYLVNQIPASWAWDYYDGKVIFQPSPNAQPGAFRNEFGIYDFDTGAVAWGLQECVYLKLRLSRKIVGREIHLFGQRQDGCIAFFVVQPRDFVPTQATGSVLHLEPSASVHRPPPPRFFPAVFPLQDNHQLLMECYYTSADCSERIELIEAPRSLPWRSSAFVRMELVQAGDRGDQQWDLRTTHRGTYASIPLENMITPNAQSVTFPDQQKVMWWWRIGYSIEPLIHLSGLNRSTRLEETSRSEDVLRILYTVPKEMEVGYTGLCFSPISGRMVIAWKQGEVKVYDVVSNMM